MRFVFTGGGGKALLWSQGHGAEGKKFNEREAQQKEGEGCVSPGFI